MDDLVPVISEAEQRWLKPIANHLLNVYASIHLPSHDASHHLRVWAYCQELMKQLVAHRVALNFTVEQALIASLFHDVGLTLDTGEFHGYQSRLLCEKFFNNNKHLTVEGLTEILYAIEHHDDKRFKNMGLKPNPVNLVTLISTADDLDAFGLVGVFRYLEIYAIRGIPIEDIPQKVLSNLDNRFANFKQNFGYMPILLDNHSSRYDVTKGFFKEMQNDFINGTSSLSESINIAQTLIISLVEKQYDIKTVIAHGLAMDASPKGVDFYLGLIQGLEL
ncbi:MAG TPA: HD domain-containing protein [Perlabentimonas sp.]|nr:HD domain-containing protein [Tenuifilaceae bacterium]HZJ74564.1 HD domain-containing protein [Perlabentimonas sp.]